MNSTCRGTYCELYGTEVLIVKYMVPGYLFELYGTGVLIVKSMVPEYLF